MKDISDPNLERIVSLLVAGRSVCGREHKALLLAGRDCAAGIEEGVCPSVLEKVLDVVDGAKRNLWAIALFDVSLPVRHCHSVGDHNLSGLYGFVA